MSTQSILLAKIAGLQKNFSKLRWTPNGRITANQVEHLINQYFKLEEQIRAEMPDLFSDLPEITTPEPVGKGANNINLFGRNGVTPILQNIDYIMEVRVNHRIGEKKEEEKKLSRIFISHGRSKEWYKVQVFLEKDLDLETLELAQEANLGRSVLQKLDEESRKCSLSIIVMTGDDEFGDEIRARENVLHEVGFFQGKYGLRNVVLLHEEEVNIPSNIHGLVYIPFPKDTVEATFAALQKELKILLA